MELDCTMQKKVAIITGTSSGVGLELSLLLALEGYIVYATMRDLSKKDNLLNKAQELGLDNIIVEQLDITQVESINKCITKIINSVGYIDLLVNNAGAGFIRTVEQATEDDIKWVMDTNYLGVVNCVKAVIPHMRHRKSGHIINISSVGGLVGQPLNELYCGAKFAVEGFTEAMASYMTKYFNIYFTLVEPGGIESDFVKNVYRQLESSGGIFNDEYKVILDTYMKNAASRLSTQNAYQSQLDVAKFIIEKVVKATTIPLRIRTSKWAEQFSLLKTVTDL